MRLRLLVVSLLLVVCSYGCGNKQGADNKSDTISVSNNKQYEYEVPECKPGVLVDRLGYKPEDEKIAVFENEHGDTFSVVDDSTGEVVFQGQIADGKGYFTQCITPGTYYIETDIVGRSYIFSIGENVYDNLFVTVVGLFANNTDTSGGWYTDGKNNKSVKEASKSLLNILMAYELSEESFEDEDNDGIPDIIKICQDEATWLYNSDWTNNEENSLRVAALSRFAGIYKKYDESAADKLLKDIESDYKELKSEYKRGKLSEEYWYMVNAELLKTTGKKAYKKIVEELLSAYDLDGCDSVTFAGDYAYLTTSKNANADMCKVIMDKLLKKAEAIALDSDKGNYFISNEESNASSDISIMSYINFVITNREYRGVLAGHLHYLLGVNEDREVYLTKSYKIGDEDYMQSYSELLLILINMDNKFEN